MTEQERVRQEIAAKIQALPADAPADYTNGDFRHGYVTGASDTIMRALDVVDSIAAQAIGELEKDAARYRWLRENRYVTFCGTGVKGNELDNAIDAAMKART